MMTLSDPADAEAFVMQRRSCCSAAPLPFYYPKPDFGINEPVLFAPLVVSRADDDNFPSLREIQ